MIRITSMHNLWLLYQLFAISCFNVVVSNHPLVSFRINPGSLCYLCGKHCLYLDARIKIYLFLSLRVCVRVCVCVCVRVCVCVCVCVCVQMMYMFNLYTACKVVAHTTCISQLYYEGICCKSTFREIKQKVKNVSLYILVISCISVITINKLIINHTTLLL